MMMPQQCSIFSQCFVLAIFGLFLGGCHSNIYVDDNNWDSTDDSGGTDNGGTDSTMLSYCHGLPFLNQPPDLDGILDEDLKLETVEPVGWRNADTPLPDGHRLRYATAWRKNGLYFFLEVTDPDRNPADSADSIWYGDGVEIFVDHDAVFHATAPNYDTEGAVHFFASAPQTDHLPSNRAEWRTPPGGWTPWDTSSWIVVPTETGYNAETFIDAANLNLSTWQLSSGDTVSFNLSHNVSVPPGETGNDGNRLSQYFLLVREPLEGNHSDYPYDNLSVSCPTQILSP